MDGQTDIQTDRQKYINFKASCRPAFLAPTKRGVHMDPKEPRDQLRRTKFICGPFGPPPVALVILEAWCH